jgi:hypothetical protein
MRTKKVKPPPSKFEYVLNISKEHDDIFKKDYISFKFRTAKEFLTFRYLLNILEEINGSKINFNIIGFKAPIGDLSNHGYAAYEYRFYDFKFAEYQILITRKDVDNSKFKLKIARSKSKPLTISSVSKNTFIEIVIT